MRPTRSQRATNRRASRRGRRHRFSPRIEPLESRLLLATVFVNSTTDNADGTATSIADLIAAPGNDGVISLREAIHAANGTPGADTIAFNIPYGAAGHKYYRNDGAAGVSLVADVPAGATSDADLIDSDPHWSHSWWSIAAPTGLPTITNELTILGFSQPGSVPNAELVGSNAIHRVEIDFAEWTADTFHINGSNNTLDGLVVNRAPANAILVRAGDRNRIVGNFIGTDVSGTVARGVSVGVRLGVRGITTGNTIGGPNAADRNLIVAGITFGPQRYAVYIHNDNTTAATPLHNVVQGNYIGTNADGTAALQGGLGHGIFLSDASSNEIRGNLISGTNTGIGSAGFGQNAHNLIASNLIGLNASGTEPLPNVGYGIYVDDRSFGTRIESNVIAGNASQSLVRVYGGTVDQPIQIVDNYLGSNASGTAAIPNFIGFTVDVAVPTAHARIQGNRIRAGNPPQASHSGIGIDLAYGGGAGGGVNANDSLDIDGDANGFGLQNFPVLTDAQEGTELRVSGTLHSLPNTWFELEFFHNSEEFREGERPLGTHVGQTNADGDLSFTDLVFPDGMRAYRFVTATATRLADPDNNPVTAIVPIETSEFSAPLAIHFNSPPTISNIEDQAIPVDTGVATVTFTVGDAETVASDLVVTARSSNQTLIPDGNLAVAGGGAERTVTLTPPGNQTGSATITVDVSDGRLTASDTFVVTIGHVPVARNDVFSVEENSSLFFDPLLNDSDADSVLAIGGTHFGSVVLDSGPSHGSLSVVSGLLRYQPHANYQGLDEFQYRATDGIFESNLATVSITVVDRTPPAAPTDLQTSPTSPADNNHPSITGTAEPDSTVMLYSTANCTGIAAGTLVADSSGRFAITVTVGDNTTTTFFATATDAAGNTSPCSDAGVTYIESSFFVLDVTNSGTGSGLITSAPAGIDCGSDCAEPYLSGSSITLTATPDANSTFAGWSGACTGSGTCTVTIDAAKSVVAAFSLRAFPLTVVIAGGTASGGVSSTPFGISCTPDCTETYTSGTSVSLTATPNVFYEFAGWSGACTGIGECTVSMDAAKSVTATFKLSPTFLTITKDGSGAGTITSVPAAIDCGSTCTAAFSRDSLVTLTATPDPKSTFAGWSGVCVGTGTCTVTMDTFQKIATATFEKKTALLTVVNPSGGGAVTSIPAGIDCGSDCSESYEIDTLVTLTAVPVAGATFAGWSGDCTGTGTCNVALHVDKSVSAQFRFPLTVGRTGDGSGVITSEPAGINCGIDCTESYAVQSLITLTAAPDANSTFAGWSGACTGMGTCEVTMDAVKDVTATFGQVTYLLTVAAIDIAGPDGQAGGVVTSFPAGIHCGSDCTELYRVGSFIELEATPNANSWFAGWNASCRLVQDVNACGIKMDSHQGVVAWFALLEFPLTVTKTGTGDGIVSSSPTGIHCGADCTNDYVVGSVVELTAIPAPDSRFIGWGGDCANAVDVCTVTVDSSKDILATFALADTAPRISGLVDLSILEDTPTPIVGFEIDDTETPASDLTVMAMSSDTALIPDANIVLGGSGANRTLTIVPGDNRHGSAIITLSVSDGHFTVIETFRLTVTAVNDPPVALDDVPGELPTTLEDFAVEMDVVANDWEPDGDSLVVVQVTPAMHGEVAIIEAGRRIRYTPRADFHGLDQFTYSISDGIDAAEATVSVTVAAVNDSPIAADDVVATVENESLTLNLLANDVDVDGDSLQIVQLNQPEIGYVQRNADGTVTFTPPFGFSGTSHFSYEVSDGEQTGSAQVIVTITHAESFAGSITGQSFEDVDADGLHDPDEPGLNGRLIELVLRDSNQVVASQTTRDIDLDGDGVIDPFRERGRYWFEAHPGTYDIRQAAEVGWHPASVVTIRQVSVDESGAATSSGFNTLPVIDAAGRFVSFAAERPYQFAGVGTQLVLRDLYTGESHELPMEGGFEDQVSRLPQAAVSADGRWLAYEQLEMLDRPYLVTQLVDLRLWLDGIGTGPLTTTLSRVPYDGRSPSPPALSADGRYTAFLSADPHGFAVAAQTNVFVYDRYNATYELISTAEDGTPAAGDSRNVAITLDGRSVAFFSAADNLVPEDSGLVDLFVVDRSTRQVDRIPAGRPGLPTPFTRGGELAMSADARVVTFTSTNDALVAGDSNGVSDVFVFDRMDRDLVRVSAGRLGSDSNGASDLPEISADGRYVVFRSAASNLVANDSNDHRDIFVHDRTQNSTTRLNVNALGEQANGQTLDSTLTPDGSLVVFSSAASNLAGGDDNGDFDVFLRVMPRGLAVDSGQQRFGPDFGNRADLPPSISGLSDYTIDEDSFLAPVPFHVTDDMTHAEEFVVTATSSNQALIANRNITLGGSGANRTIAITPALNQNGLATITVLVSDGKLVSAATVTITVLPVNDPPFTRPDFVETLEDTGVRLDPLANDLDVDGDSLIVVGVDDRNSQGRAIVNSDRTITFLPEDDFWGFTEFLYAASDPSGAMSMGTVRVYVLPVNDLPVAIDDRAATTEGLTLDVLANDFDLDGDTLKLDSVNTIGTRGQVRINTDSTLTYTSPANYSGADTFDYTLRAGGRTSTGRVTVLVANREHDLIVAKEGSGEGTITSVPAGIVCGPNCGQAFQNGTQVSLTAIPTAGATFVGWSGDCSGTGDCHVTMASAKNVTATFQLDADQDGVIDSIENASTNSGDANFDGILDSQQANVSSLPNGISGTYLTVVSPQGSRLTSVQTINNPSPSDAPKNAVFPFGFVEFAVKNLPPNQPVTVTLLVPANMKINSYFKYGPTPDKSTPHWYSFNYDSVSKTGAKFQDVNNDGTKDVVLHFVDGGRGDDDLTINGAIVDPGTLAVDATPAFNRQNPLDVNDDGVISPVDALVIFNDLNARGSRLLNDVPTDSLAQPQFVDSNGDGVVAPLDALLIINHLNNPSTIAAEAEASKATWRIDAVFPALDAFPDRAPHERRVLMLRLAEWRDANSEPCCNPCGSLMQAKAIPLSSYHLGKTSTRIATDELFDAAIVSLLDEGWQAK